MIWRWVCLLLFRNRFAIAIASLVWLIWRSGPQPRRLAYPCQQTASANVGALAVLIIPALARRGRAGSGRLRNAFQLATGSVLLGGFLFLLVSAGVTVYSNATDEYTPGNPAVVGWTPIDPATPTPMSSQVLNPTSAEAVVAVNRDPAVTYGTEPYGPGANTAYDLVWKTVADLRLGPAENPLADLIQDVDGDGKIEVMIKPNTVEHYANSPNGDRNPVHVHPAMIRPLVDMAARAGAKVIQVGDGSDREGYYFTGKMDPMGYTAAYFNAMNALWPGVSITRVDLSNRAKWSWVGLSTQPGGASAWAGSGYSSSDLAKSSQGPSYFYAADSHGRPGPGNANCMGWLAISDYLLDADVVIDLAKLKVHYIGVNTAAIKNWVGITMFSTFDSSMQYWSRLAHEPVSPSEYEKQFGNDIIWRELVDAHRAVLYWRDGVMNTTPQRRCLVVMDAINAAEKYHCPNVPWPYWLKTVMAGVDPVSVDAVGSRLQRYDFRRIPIVNNAHALSIGSPWPMGTADPAKVRVVGGTPVDATYNHTFLYELSHDPNQTWPDWNQLQIGDLTPPVVNAAVARDAGGGQWDIQVNITGGHVAYFYYGDAGGGRPKVMRLGRNGETYSATVSGPLGDCYGVAQDAFFNSTSFTFTNLPVIGPNPRTIERHIHVGESTPDDAFSICNLGADTLTYSVGETCSWVNAVPTDNQSTGECDPVVVRYDSAELPPGTYECPITISGNALNTPQTVTVKLVIETVLPDFDRDGDVDMSDFGHLQACLTGAGVPSANLACADARLDLDEDIDQADLTMLRNCLSGDRQIALKTCDDPP